MKILEGKKNKGTYDFVVQVDKKAWETEQEKALESLSKNVKIDGFRKGKVPKSEAIKRVNPMDVLDRAINKIVGPTATALVDSKEFKKVEDDLLDIPPKVEVSKVEKTNLELKFTYTLYPDVTVSGYKDIKVKAKLEKVTEDIIKKEIDGYLVKNAMTVPKNGPIAKGDIATFDFKGFVDKKPFQGGEAKNFELLDSNIGGSTGAGLYKDGNGNKFVIKTYHGNKDQVNNELLANQIYKLFGVNVPDSKIVKLNDQIGVANSYIDGLTKFTDEDKSSDKFKKQVLDKFVIDALLANWDTVGLTFDNLLKDKNGNFYRIDNGGALLYRAQGEPKGAAFGKKVLELDSLRNPNINTSSANVFSALTNEDIVKQIESIDDSVKEKIKDIIKDIYIYDDIDT